MICHQLPLGSLPVISILVLAGIIPNTVLAVDGSRRTFTCVDVTPSTGGTVGGGEADRGVSVGEALIVSGNVEGIIGGVSVAVVSFWSPEAQLVLRSRIR